MAKFTRKQISEALFAVLEQGHKVAVSFTRDLKQRVRVTEKQYSRPTRSRDIVMTFDKPNYEEREFLKLCKKAKTRPKSLWFPHDKRNTHRRK